MRSREIESYFEVIFEVTTLSIDGHQNEIFTTASIIIDTDDDVRKERENALKLSKQKGKVKNKQDQLMKTLPSRDMT